MGLHTAIETSGYLGDHVDDKYLANLDLVLLDIKSSNPETYRSGHRPGTRSDLALCRAARRAWASRVWVRFTLVPGFTDDPANVEGIARFVAPMKNVEWVEVQPFHQLGAFKWKAMKLDYKHVDTPTPTPDLDQSRDRAISRRGLQRPLAGFREIPDLMPGNFSCSILLATSSAPSPFSRRFLPSVSAILSARSISVDFRSVSAAFLFVGLALGAFAPKAQIVGPIGLTGLIMFLYGIGILYGRQFFEGMTGSAGRKYNLLALIAVVAGLLVALGLGHAFGIKVGHTLGIFAGSMTSTATLQAALDVMNNKDPSIGYSIAYPFGVIGPILCIYFMTQDGEAEISRRRRSASTWARFRLARICAGQRLDELNKDLPSGVQVTMIRKGGQNIVPADDVMLSPGDGLLVIAEREDAIAEAAAQLGKLEPGRIVKDRSDLDYIRVFVGKANVVGVPLAQPATADRLSGPSAACEAL